MVVRRSAAVAFAIGCLSLTACEETAIQSEIEAAAEQHGGGHTVLWGYEDDDGPALWGAMKSEWRLCTEGLEQSPIDLTNATEIQLPDAEIQTPNAEWVEVLNQEGVISALDIGHTIQINSRTGETMRIGEQKYGLVQFHFHAPSEHTVGGRHVPMEMHLVHRADDGALAVVGVFVEEGAENSGIVPLWAARDDAPGTESTVRVPVDFPDRVFSGESTGVFYYGGSLTTPPCSEGVQWYIRKTPTQFWKGQIAEFAAFYDHNSRPVQALNARELYLDPNPTFKID